MNYCTKCGAELPENKIFCTKCGTKVKDTNGFSNEPLNNTEHYTAVSSTANTPLAANTARTTAPKPLTKKQKLGMIIGGSAAAVLLALYLVGSSLTSRDRIVENFKKAMTAKDGAKVASMLVSSDNRLVIDEAGVKTLFAYFDKNPSSLNNVLSSLDSSGSVISVKKEGKKFLFYDNYVFDIKPVFLNVTTNFKDTKIFVEDKEVAAADKENFAKEVGPFMPGIHKVKAVLKGDYVDLEKAEDITTFNASASEASRFSADLYIEASTLDIYTPFINSKIFINGKDTGITTSEAKKLGPVATNGGLKLYIQKDLPFGTCKSKEIEVKDNHMELQLEASEDVKTAASKAVSDYFTSEVEAYKALDVNKLKSSTEEHERAIFNDLENFKSNSKVYAGKLEKIVLDMNSLVLIDDSVELAPNYAITVGGKLYLDDITYYQGDSNTATKKREQNANITLCYDFAAKTWQVNNINYYYNFDDGSTGKKEIVVSK